MIQKKSLIWFLAITFVFSWILFLIPLLYRDSGPIFYGRVTQICFALAMGGPGIAALVVTLFVDRQPFRTLGLGRLGPKRFYLWALFLPSLLALLAGLFTILFGVGEFDPAFTLMRQLTIGTPEGLSFELMLILQLAFTLLLAPIVNLPFALGEELGWRGYLLPKLLPLGQWPAILISGAIWGFWHAPAILQGLNYPEHPVAGVFLMVLFCVLLGALFSWLYLNTRSPWVAALGHGSVNATAALSLYLFLKPDVALTYGGTLASLSGLAALALGVGLLVLTRRLPVRLREEIPVPES